MIRARRADHPAVAAEAPAPAPAAAATQPESQVDVEARRALGFDDGEMDARVRALSELGAAGRRRGARGRRLVAALVGGLHAAAAAHGCTPRSTC